MKITLPIIKFKLPNLPFIKVAQVGFILLYILGCALVLIPQIDYQAWYPSSVGTHDYKPGIEFQKHKKLTIELPQEELQSNEMNSLIVAIYQRARRSDIQDLYIERTETTLNIHVPNEYSDNYMATLISPGKIEFKKLKKPEDPEAELNPADMFNLNNYEDTGIKSNKIRSAKITNVADSYTYIELKTDADQIRRLTKIANDPDNPTFAMMVDGDLNIAWILPPDNVNTTNPTIVIMKEPQESEVLISQILNDPVPIDPLPYEISESEPLYSETILYWAVGAVLGIFALGLSFKMFVQKKSLKEISIQALLIIGLLTVLKLIPISFSLPVILTVIVSVCILSTIQISHYVTVLGLLFTSSIILYQSSNPSLRGSASVLFVTSIYSLTFYLISYFSRLYEEE